jgi:hypothetical protein
MSGMTFAGSPKFAYCHVLEWLSTGFWIGYWIYWPLTDRNLVSRDYRLSKYGLLFTAWLSNWPVPSLAVISHQPSQTYFLLNTFATDWLPQIVPVITSWHGPRRKYLSSVAVTLLRSCLLFSCCVLRISCLATDVVPLFVSRPLSRNECFGAVS